MGGRSLQYVMLSPPSTRTDGVARLELYGDARVTGGVLTLTLTLTPTLRCLTWDERGPNCIHLV